MKDIRSKLLPEVAEKIESIKDEFPETYSRIQKSLDKQLVMYLTIEEAMRITMYTDNSLGNIYNLFV